MRRSVSRRAHDCRATGALQTSVGAADEARPVQGFITERLAAAAPERIPGSVLLTELRERGYGGGYTMLKLFLAALRPKEIAEPVIRFETEPGEQMQTSVPQNDVNFGIGALGFCNSGNKKLGRCVKFRRGVHPANDIAGPLVPRTRRSHHCCRESDCELRVQSGTRIIDLLVSFDSEVRVGACGKLRRTSESGH
jgi:hypothetical protein